MTNSDVYLLVLDACNHMKVGHNLAIQEHAFCSSFSCRETEIEALAMLSISGEMPTSVVSCNLNNNVDSQIEVLVDTLWAAALCSEVFNSIPCTTFMLLDIL